MPEFIISYLDAYEGKLDSCINLPFQKKPFREDFVESGHLIINTETYYAVIASKKGGVYKIFDNNVQSSLGEKVYPPEGYHWMNDDGHYTLMQDPSSGYSKHPDSSLTADVPIFPKFLPQPKNIDLEIKSSTDSLSLEVVPPDQYHWMSNGSSYSLMKTPRSGYGPHPGSSLVANFKIYQHNQSVRKSSGEGTEYRGPGLSSASTKASNLLYETLGKARATDVTNLFQKIDKQLWNKNICSLKMFVHPDILANITEANITGKEISPSDIKVPNSASEWGY